MINEKEFRNMKLNAWDGIVLSAGVEEDLKDIHVAIKYNDHGDDFLFIQTKDGKQVEYGFWCNRKFETSYEDLKPVEDDPSSRFIRNPFLYVKSLDNDASVSNKLFFALDKAFAKSRMSFGYDLVCTSREEAQRRFESGLKAFDEAFNSGVFYDYSDKTGQILYFLKQNGIDTPENIERLKHARVSSKLDGIDGVAGKRISNVEYLVGDGVKFAMVDGEEINPKNLIFTYSDYSDEWGFSSKYLPIDQFNPDAITNYKEEIKERITVLRKQLADLEQNIDNYSLRVLNEYREVLSCDLTIYRDYDD